MKTQTHFHLLIAGIFIVPILLIIGQIVYIKANQDQEAISMYHDIAAIIDGETDFENRKMLSAFLYRMSRFGDIVVFNKDFTIIYSTIPEFTSGTFMPLKEVLSLVNQRDERYSYFFESPRPVGNNGFILIRRDRPLLRWSPFRPAFYPVGILLGVFLCLIIFSITMSLFIARSMTKSIMVLENATMRIADGELDFIVEAKGSNEIRSLTNSLNKLRDTLKEDERRRYRFIMGVTHDLKTPLASIKAYAEAIEDGIAKTTAAGVSATGIIKAKADRLESMLSDLIEFVRMDTGEWRSRLKNTNLSAFLRQSAKLFALDSEMLHHEFRYNSTLPDTVFVLMDERLVQRALENIVNNAIRYTPDGSVISLNAVLAGDVVHLVISDNGPGIDEADLPHIFEMFFRGSSSRREQGMGMGLPVVKWVTDWHAWGISVSSEKGTGVCFTITIPTAL
ncbi:MAG: HAMP domain-containing histidine kinase [Treponema sp.]|jgi:signal transduction histidine kinase|nr:HAMP domain-containing histidine kinase [Treponema sp.]